jgi:energy-coupling factor transporter ATP-binding protein EcfA2
VVCEDVAFTYAGREGIPALDGVSLEIAEGEFVAVSGLNG